MKLCLTKGQRRLKKVIKDIYDDDWENLLILERTQLENMLDYFGHNALIIFDNAKRKISQISLCINLINIIIDNDTIDDDKYVNIKNAKRFLFKDDIFEKNDSDKKKRYIIDELYKLKAENLYYLIRKYNTRDWWI